MGTTVALDACIIEKHVTLSRSDGGSDSAFSLEPTEIKTLCNEVKDAWMALGEVKHGTVQAKKTGVRFRRSLYSVKYIKAGGVITSDVIRSIRPSFSLPPKHYDELVGRLVKQSVNVSTVVQGQLVD